MADAADTHDEKEARRRKQLKKMTRIVAKAWNILPDAEPFQESTLRGPQLHEGPPDLSSVGQSLDDGGYQHGRSGWEKFSRDIGGVYNRHIISRNAHAKAAKIHLREVVKLLAKIDPHLSEIAMAYHPPECSSETTSVPKKRRAAGSASDSANISVPKKKHASGTTGTRLPSGEHLTLSQREHKAMEALGNFLEDCGGAKEQASNFRCKVSQRGGDRLEIVYFSSQGRRLRSMIDVARFLNLSPGEKSASSSGPTSTRKQHTSVNRPTVNTGMPRNFRECESEKKKLRRELDKLLRAHGKATKMLDDFRNEHRDDKNPIDDEVLIEEENQISTHVKSRRARHIAHQPDIAGFPGIPADCTADLLMVWDFLCTFGRALSLMAISLDDFVAALTYQPSAELKDHSVTSSCIVPPVYVSEAHLALLRLLLQDPSSDDWWWSTLENDEIVADSTEHEAGVLETNVSDIQKKRIGEGNDPLIPVIKVDMAALLAVEEDPSITARWLQALEDVRSRKTNAGGPIKSAVKSAMGVTTNQYVKSYLKRSMRSWRNDAAGLTKRAVVWLIDHVREARPDLWGRKVSEEAVAEQKKKVAHEAALAMEQVNEDAYVDNVKDINLDEGSGEESDSDESDVDDEDDDDFEENPASPTNIDASNNQVEGIAEKKDENSLPVRSAVPLKPAPSLVDLLLPPSKPLPSSDLVSSFTWPSLAGAVSCRILHRYKRRKNEVDDSLRELRELPPMTISERRRREANAAGRILSECVSSNDCKGASIENAIQHLCAGKSYLDITPVQKLCILRLLIEAAYDTSRVYECVDNNYKARVNAMKLLETEERRAKREAREETAAAESAARERLASEARSAFLDKKRREILRNNKHSNEFTPEFIEGLTDEDVAEFDDDTKAEYEALKGPEAFNKTEVNAMVERIQEEAAFDTNSLTVLTMEEIQAQEENELQSMEAELESFGDVDSVYQHHTADRETSAKIDKLQKEIANLRSNINFSLPQIRASAVDALKDAIEDGTVKALRSAIKSAKLARLTGIDEESNGIWALDLLRDAAMELRNAERRKRVIEAQKELVAKRNKCFVRTQPLGTDRYRNRFWHFDCDAGGRVWLEQGYFLKDCSKDENKSELSNDTSDGVNLDRDAASIAIGADDEEADLLEQELLSSNHQREKFLAFSRREYHSSGLLKGLAKKYWGCHITDQSLRLLIKDLNRRGVRESVTKAKLKEILESGGNEKEQGNKPTEGHGAATNEDPSAGHDGEADAESAFQLHGDEDAFRNAKSDVHDSNEMNEEIGLELLENVPTAIGQRVRLRRIPDPVTAPTVAEYKMGTVTGWKMHHEEKEDDASIVTHTNAKQSAELEPSARWRVAVDGGEETSLTGADLIDALCRSVKWTRQHNGYIEDDAPFLAYRNSLGRFCGRAADAAISSTPLFLAKHMLKREQEFYMPLKNRSYENNWGGKSGARNAWIASMKEYGHTFSAVRDGLLTLENAFFELSGRFPEDNVANGTVQDAVKEEESINGRDLLNDQSYRFEIELESIGNTVKGLWNSKETRAIFKEIIQTTTTTSFLALGLDLLCRNCTAYLHATKSALVRSSVEQPRGTRRLNAWQQAHQNNSFY